MPGSRAKPLRRAGIDADSTTGRDGLSALRLPPTTPPQSTRSRSERFSTRGVRVITLSVEERSLEDAYLASWRRRADEWWLIAWREIRWEVFLDRASSCERACSS